MNAKSKVLDLPNYVFDPKFSKEKFMCFILGRIGEFCEIKNKVYIFAVTFNRLAKIITVTQNNEKRSVGFPGGRVTVDIRKCPENQGSAHAYLNYIPQHANNDIPHDWNRNPCSSVCMNCGLVDLKSLPLESENERRFMWRVLKQWVGEHKRGLKQFCAESETAAAVRLFKKETGLTFLKETHLFNCGIIRLGLCKFYVIGSDGGLGKNNIVMKQNAPRVNEIKSVDYRSFDDLLKLSESGEMSNIHSQFFKHYLETSI